MSVPPSPVSAAGETSNPAQNPSSSKSTSFVANCISSSPRRVRNTDRVPFFWHFEQIEGTRLSWTRDHMLRKMSGPRLQFWSEPRSSTHCQMQKIYWSLEAQDSCTCIPSTHFPKPNNNNPAYPQFLRFKKKNHYLTTRFSCYSELVGSSGI